MAIHEPHKIEVKREGKWNESNYEQIKQGATFRMYHENGEPFCYDCDEEVEFIANSDPFYDEELGVWLVRIK